MQEAEGREDGLGETKMSFGMLGRHFVFGTHRPHEWLVVATVLQLKHGYVTCGGSRRVLISAPSHY